MADCRFLEHIMQLPKKQAGHWDPVVAKDPRNNEIGVHFNNIETPGYPFLTHPWTGKTFRLPKLNDKFLYHQGEDKTLNGKIEIQADGETISLNFRVVNKGRGTKKMLVKKTDISSISVQYLPFSVN